MTPLPTPVLAVPHLGPENRRIDRELPAGLTLQEILEATLPSLPKAEHAQCRIALVTPHGSQIVLPQYWSRVRPRPGVRVVIRVVSDKSALRSVLSVVIAIAAVAAGQYWAIGAIGSSTFAISSALITAGVTIVGNLLINALIPPVKADDRDAENRYSISGFRNTVNQNGAVPVVFGQIRYAPPFAALSYTEIVGDWQYIRTAFNLGEGQLSISDIRIGETSIGEYTSVETETRDGLDTDLPLSLYPQQVAEEAVSVELTRPLPRDDLGEIIEDDPAIETPVVRTTGADANGTSIILSFPSGLVRFNDNGKKLTEAVSVRIEHRLAEAEEWQEVDTLDIRAKKLESFYRQYSWTFPSRGRWQVRMTMLTDENTDSQRQRRCMWAAIQTLRPEYPLNYPRPLALISARIKATHQLSGALDNCSAFLQRVCPDYDADTGTWIERATSNPASLYRFALQSPAYQKAVGDAGIDIDQLQGWHDFCREKGLKYDSVQDQAGTKLRDVLTEIAAAGRATPRHDGVKWGVTIDRAQDQVVAHINPRNSWDFRCTRTYVTPPHAFRVKFQDATNDFKDAERVIRWPGYEGDIEITEGLELPGKTDPAEIWIEARRRMYEAIYRPDVYRATQSGSIRAATRGDKVMVSHDVLDKFQRAARVKSVVGQLVELDERITMTPGESYAIRFRVFADEEDTIGESVVSTVRTDETARSVIYVHTGNSMPQEGDLVHFGQAGVESFAAIVNRVEATQDGHQILYMIDEAPIIDELLEADTVPAWSGRVGAEIDENLLQPSAPRFASVATGIAGTGSSNLVIYLLEPGSGAVATAQYEIWHRLTSSAEWTEVTISSAAGGGEISSYAKGNTVELKARGISATGQTGPWSATVIVVVGEADAAIPAALDDEAIDITTLLGGALIQVATGADDATTGLQVYRSRSATLDRETDAVGSPISVTPLQSYSITLGDTTREELITGGNMDTSAAWTAAANWTVAAGIAQHTAGAADALTQAFATETGKWYRLSFSITGRTAGSVTPRLTGGSTRTGSAVSADGSFSDRIQATTGNDTLEFLASSDLDGAIDDVSAYLETDACLDQGAHYIWIEPQNDDGVPGPASGPFMITI